MIPPKTESKVKFLILQLNRMKKLSGVGDLPPARYIGLQDHSTPNNVYFRNVRIRKLKNLVPAGGI